MTNRFALGAASALTALLMVAGVPALAADHRDSPVVDDDPAADINDVYMFRDPDDKTKLVMVLSTYPLENPRFATSYQYDPDVIFEIGIDLDGDGTPDRFVEAKFSRLTDGAGSLQTVTVTLPGGKKVTGDVTQPTIQTPEPAPTIINQDGIKVFAGQRDDPFFFDLIGFNRVVAKINATSVNGGKGQADPSLLTHKDSFAGFNVQALVIEAPITDFVGKNQKFGISAFSYRKVGPKIRNDARTITVDGLKYESVDRMGNPAVNTAFISPSLKDGFNTSLPKNDATKFASVVLASLKKYGTSAKNTKILASVVFPDTLKLDLSKPDGFPNGRRLQDDVIDTELQLVFNQPLGGGFGDGVDSNDRPFLPHFPFVAYAHTAAK
ncbi:MAG TPA: DUF4331 family protein [Alphaproteobacteria bacterium]|nr:DUF4331 family protein [Alphaproteobacteria bacterium]